MRGLARFGPMIACAIALLPLSGAASTKRQLLHVLEQSAPHLSDADRAPDTTALLPYYHPELIAQIRKGYLRPTHCGAFDPLACSSDSETRLLRTLSFTVNDERVPVACLGVRQLGKNRAHILAFARSGKRWRLLAAAPYLSAGNQIDWKDLLEHCPRAPSKWNQVPLEPPFSTLNSARYASSAVPGATVTVTGPSGWSFDVATGADGKFTVDGLPGGLYETRVGSAKMHVMLTTLTVPGAPVRGE